MKQTHENFRVYLLLHQKNGKPAIELRTMTSNHNAMVQLIEAALLDKPVIVFPTFRDRLRAIATLKDKEILEYNFNTGKYQFKI